MSPRTRVTVPRGFLSTLRAWLAVCLLVGLALPAVADVAEAEGLFHRAEMAERGVGDLDRAADLYAQAAAAYADDVERRAQAEVRAASCLRKLGRTERAAALLVRWAAEDSGASKAVRRLAASELATTRTAPRVPGSKPSSSAVTGESGPNRADPGEPSDLERELRRTRRELDRKSLALDQALENEERTSGEVADLVQELKAAESELERLRTMESPDDAATALRIRQEQLREQSRRWARWAGTLHRNGHFSEARGFLAEALQADPDNVAARALLSRVSAPIGARERLYQGVLEVRALAREVRAARIRQEVESLLDEAGSRQENDDFLGSAQPLAAARALLGSEAAPLRSGAELSARVDTLVRVAESHGARVRRLPTSAAARADDRWMEPLRQILSVAGAEVARGLDLKFHDMGRALGTGSAGLPPVGPKPKGWRLSGERVSAPDLLAAYLQAAEAEALRSPGASLEAEGFSAVTVAPTSVHERLHTLVTGLELSPGSSLSLDIAAIRAPAGEWASLASRHGLALIRAGEARAVVLSSAQMARIENEIASKPHETVASASLVAATMRAFRIDAGPVRGSRHGSGADVGPPPIRVRILPVGGGRPGIALEAQVSWAPSRRPDGPRLRQTAVVGAQLDPGSAVALVGLADPSDPEWELAVVVRVGRRGGRPDPKTPPKPRRKPSPVPGKTGTPGTGAVEATEHFLPVWLTGLHDVGPSPLSPSRPVPDRMAGLRARLAKLAPSATLAEPEDDRIVVVGPPQAQEAVRKLVTQLAHPGVQTFRVAVHQISPGEERKVVEIVSPTPDLAFAWAVVRRGGAQRRLAGLLAGFDADVPLLTPRVSAPPTGRADVARVVRSLYRKGLDVERRGDLSWGRSETAWVDEGLLLAIRPFGRTADGRFDFDLALRARYVPNRASISKRTALGDVNVMSPRVQSVWGDLTVTLRPEDWLVIASMVSPFPPRGERDRLVVIVRPEE